MILRFVLLVVLPCLGFDTFLLTFLTRLNAVDMPAMRGLLGGVTSASSGSKNKPLEWAYRFPISINKSKV